MLHALSSRQLVRVRKSVGLKTSAVSEFLQGLVTQDMRRFEKSRVLGTVLLNSKGRMLVDGLIWKEEEPDSFLLDLPAESSDSIASMLVRHKLREPFTIEVVPIEELAVHVDFSNAQGDADPRSPELPKRVIQPPSGKSDTADYTTLRMMAGVPEGPSEVPYDSAIPVFYNFDLMNSISLAKGCYTGQELITRTLRRGVVRRRCFGLKLGEGVVNIATNATITSGPTEIGRIVATNGGFGIGLLQLGGMPLNDRAQVKEAWDKFSASKHVKVGGSVDAELFLPKYML